MPIAQHFQWFLRLFSKAADSDSDPESPEREDGWYTDSQNMRNTSIDGHMGAIEKIHGEQVNWANIDNRPTVTGCLPSGGSGLALPLSYFCIGTVQVLNHIVEFWADELNVGVPYVRVDGWVVLMPSLASEFPISFSYPPQLDKNDSCVGGEVFYTDDHIAPFILNVNDMLENAGVDPSTGKRDIVKYPPTSKYFCGFNVQDFQVQPPSQLDHPVFIEICPTGSQPNTIGIALSKGTGGMQSGAYQYGIQYVDSSGNTTNWSELTPQIPVPYGMGYSQNVYPSTKVYGGLPGSTYVTGNAIHIRFRITNLLNYAGFNIRRVSWDAGASLNTAATDDSVIYSSTTGFLTAGQISVIDFYDQDNSTLSPVAQSQSTQNSLSSIQSAKAIRYYQSRLTLWNVTYASKDLTKTGLTFNTTNGTMYPFVRPLGVQGYKDIWNDVYRKSYFRGERYGFALVGFDMNGNQSFAIPIPSFNNYQMPNRRDQLSGASLLASVEVFNSSLNPLPLTQNVNSSGTISPTFEVYDLVNATMRDPNLSSINITANPGGNIWNGTDGFPKVSGGQGNNYDPFRPVSDSDGSNSFDYRYTVSVNDGSASDPNIGIGIGRGSSVWSAGGGQIYSGFLPFQPQAFLPNLYALGMILQGISGLPNWVSAFAIVRTPPAGRVLAQGQGFYNINMGVFPNKDTQGMIWNSPDFKFGIIPNTNVNTILSNLSRYKAQVVSPQGFFSEVFQGWSAYSDKITSGSIFVGTFPPIGVPDSEVDMISYCRVPYDKGAGLINPIASGNSMGSNGNTANGYQFTSFNCWRQDGTHLSPVTANQEFTINSLTQTNPSDGSTRPYSTWGSNPRDQAYYLNIGTFYHTIGSSTDYNNSQNWHEPTYVTNIVDDSQNVTNNLTQNYLQTGAYIKVTSIIGQYSAAQKVYYLVDERWQDCIPAENQNDPTANQNRFVYVEDSNKNQKAWLNVTYMSSAQITAIKAAISGTGYYVATTCTGTVNVYGIYTHVITPYTNGNLTSKGNKLYGIQFNQGLTPDAGDYIIVKYDPCGIIEVFGGDAFIGEFNYPMADCLYTSAGKPSTPSDNFLVSSPLPYRAYQYNENTWTINSNNISKAFSPKQIAFQEFNLICATSTKHFQLAMSVRQLMVNGIVESRTNVDLFFGEVTSGASSMTSDSFFPNINYIQRPLTYNGTHDIAGQYFTDYPSEDGNWGYGGFRFGYLYNYDYSETPTADESYSIPSSGFVEKLNYCTQVIWSDQRSTSEQNSPNLKNFPTTNVYNFDDSTGGINKAWDSSNAGQQGNLYAFTNHGVVMAETNKSILSSISGGQLAEIGGGNDQFIQAEVWLSRDKGMPDQMWRSAAEYSNTIYWADKADLYRLENNKIVDLGQDIKYFKVLLPILQSIGDGYGSDVTAVWVDPYQEYWLCVNPHRVIASSQFGIYVYDPQSTPANTYVVVNQDQIIDVQIPTLNILLYTINHNVVNEFYLVNNTPYTLSVWYSNVAFYTISSGQMLRFYYDSASGFFTFDKNFQNLCNDVIWGDQVKGFIGQFKYRFDKYTTDQNGNIYGSRYGATYLLDTGYTMNGTNVQSWVLFSSNPKEGYNKSKEWIRIRVSSNNVPDNILFFTTIEKYQSGNFHCAVSGFPALKNYGGFDAPSWEGYIPRGINAPNYRYQNRYCITQIFYSQPQEFWISNSALQYKLIK